MTTRKIKSAGQVLDEFLSEQAQDAELDSGTVEAIRKLRNEGKLTKTNLLRRLESARTEALRQDETSQEGAGDD